MSTGITITLIICATLLLLGFMAVVPVILICGIFAMAYKKMFEEVDDNVKSDRINGTFSKRR